MNFNKGLVIGVVLMVNASSGFANQKGTSTAPFLRIGQGARAEAMGGAFTAIANDAYAVNWNPAGLAQISRLNLAVDYLRFIEDINTQYASFILPLNRVNGSLGVSATYVDLGSIDRRDANNAVVSGDTDIRGYSGNISWGQAIGDRFALGGGVKYIGQDLAGETGSGLAGDIGALFFLVPDRFSVGAAVQNLGAKIKTGTEKEDIPLTMRGGVAFYVIPRELVLAVDAEKERDTDLTLRGGAEYTYAQRFIIRAGYRDTHEAGGGLSAGAGFIWRVKREGATDFFGREDKEASDGEGLEIRIDYGFVDWGDFDNTHRFGVHLAF